MKTPQHPAGPAFENAGDATESWRQQQIAALTETQRRLFDEARRKAEEKEKAKAKELAEREQADIRDRMRKKLLEHRHLQFNFHGRLTRMTEIVARRLVDEHFRPGGPPDHSLFVQTLQRFEREAAAEIKREHALQLKVFQAQERTASNALLQSFGSTRESFARAGVKDKSKTEFKKAAKDDAVARAIAKVKAKEEDERQRGERDQGRER